MFESENEQEARLNEAQIKKERNQELNDIRSMLKTPYGTRFLRRLMKEGRIFCSTYTGSESTYFYEGQRNLALKFFGDVAEAAPEKLGELMIEKKE